MDFWKLIIKAEGTDADLEEEKSFVPQTGQRNFFFVKMLNYIKEYESNVNGSKALSNFQDYMPSAEKWKYFSIDIFDEIIQFIRYKPIELSRSACEFIDRVDIGSMESIAKECKINIIDKFDKDIHKDFATSPIFLFHNK
jgi:hypothetical protein